METQGREGKVLKMGVCRVCCVGVLPGREHGERDGTTGNPEMRGSRKIKVRTGRG